MKYGNPLLSAFWKNPRIMKRSCKEDRKDEIASTNNEIRKFSICNAKL